MLFGEKGMSCPGRIIKVRVGKPVWQKWDWAAGNSDGKYGAVWLYGGFFHCSSDLCGGLSLCILAPHLPPSLILGSIHPCSWRRPLPGFHCCPLLQCGHADMETSPKPNSPSLSRSVSPWKQAPEPASTASFSSSSGFFGELGNGAGKSSRCRWRGGAKPFPDVFLSPSVTCMVQAVRNGMAFERRLVLYSCSNANARGQQQQQQSENLSESFCPHRCLAQSMHVP